MILTIKLNLTIDTQSKTSKYANSFVAYCISPIKLLMIFSLRDEILFVAPINQNNSAFLMGTTETFAEHAYCLVSTLPAD